MTRAGGSSREAPGLVLIIPGEPVPKGRPRFVKGSGRTYTPSRTQEAEASIRWAARIFHATLRAGPVSLTLRFYTGKGRRGRPPDLDNLTKLVMDALGNGIVWKDDHQVNELHAFVDRASSDPRTEIEWEDIYPIDLVIS